MNLGKSLLPQFPHLSGFEHSPLCDPSKLCHVMSGLPEEAITHQLFYKWWQKLYCIELVKGLNGILWDKYIFIVPLPQTLSPSVRDSELLWLVYAAQSPNLWSFVRYPPLSLPQKTTHFTCIEHSCKFLCDKMKRLILSFSTLCLFIMEPTVIVIIQSPMQTIKNYAQGICSNCFALNYNSM